MQEIGRIQPGFESGTGSIEQQGYYEYFGDDGNIYRVDYVANEGGFQPRAAHLPQAPAQIEAYAELRRSHPELFWAENGGAGIVLNSEQFVQPQQFKNQQQQQQQLVFDPQPQLVQEQLSQPQLVNGQKFEQSQVPLFVVWAPQWFGLSEMHCLLFVYNERNQSPFGVLSALNGMLYV